MPLSNTVYLGSQYTLLSTPLDFYESYVAATELASLVSRAPEKRYVSAHTIDLCGESHRRYVTKLSVQPQVSGFLRLLACRRTPSPSVQLTDWI